MTEVETAVKALSDGRVSVFQFDPAFGRLTGRRVFPADRLLPDNEFVEVIEQLISEYGDEYRLHHFFLGRKEQRSPQWKKLVSEAKAIRDARPS